MNEDGRDRRMTDEQYDDWLRGVEEAAAAKEEVDPVSTIYAHRQRVQLIISTKDVLRVYHAEEYIRQELTRHKFDMSAPIERRQITDQDATMFSGWLKEEYYDDDGSEYAAQLLRTYELRYSQRKAEGKVSRSDLYEMLTRSGMLGTDTFPRSDNSSDSYWSPREDSDYWRSARKD